MKNLLNGVSDTSLKANLYEIAGPAFAGRMAASPGDELAIQYIADWFNAHHLERPYGNIYFQMRFSVQPRFKGIEMKYFETLPSSGYL